MKTPFKAQTLPDSWASTPIGLRESAPFPNIALTEGSPDFLAAHHFIFREGKVDTWAAVAILGAGMTIPDDDLLLFKGKRVKIFAHADEKGQQGAKRWWIQLEPFAAKITAFNFWNYRKADGSPVKDLNELATLQPAELPADSTYREVLV